MKKYRIIFNGVKYRVERLWFGIFPVLERKYVDCEGDLEVVPMDFYTFEDATHHVRKKLGLIPKPKREWKVVWRGHKLI